jgi:hypothetical protein
MKIIPEAARDIRHELITLLNSEIVEHGPIDTIGGRLDAEIDNILRKHLDSFGTALLDAAKQELTRRIEARYRSKIW